MLSSDPDSQALGLAVGLYLGIPGSLVGWCLCAPAGLYSSRTRGSLPVSRASPKIGAVAVVVSGVALSAGSLLPWIAFLGPVNVRQSGVAGSVFGVIVCGLGALVLGYGLLGLKGIHVIGSAPLLVVAGLASTAAVVTVLAKPELYTSQLNGIKGFTVGVEPGVGVVLVGATAALVGAVTVVRAPRAEMNKFV